MVRAILLEAESLPAITEIDDGDLPDGDVTVAVRYSSLNYKDAMVLNHLGGLVRAFPHVPGIDLAGTVESSAVDEYRRGEPVLATGWRIGEARWGGFATRARLGADHLTRIPAGLDPQLAMTMGTAGFTAMLAIEKLENHGVGPDAGPLLTTGAAGGVGSLATMLAARCGYEVVASTGRLEERDYLMGLGANDVLARDEISEPPAKPLLSERWAGAIDAVGGDTLAHVLAEVAYGGAVASCGLAQSSRLNATVIPFLLRGVSLLGVDSVLCPAPIRDRVWSRIASLVTASDLDDVASTVGLAEVPALATAMLDGQVRGRVVVDVER